MRFLLAASLVLLLTACADAAGPDPNAHVGTYNVVTVNGSALPFTALVYEGVSTVILAGSVTLNADGTASDSYSFRYSDGSWVVDETTTDVGTYTKTGNTIVVAWASSFSPETFDYADNRLTLTESGLVVSYRK